MSIITNAFLNSIYRSTTDFETIECLIKSASFPFEFQIPISYLEFVERKKGFSNDAHTCARTQGVGDERSRFLLAIRPRRSRRSHEWVVKLSHRGSLKALWRRRERKERRAEPCQQDPRRSTSRVVRSRYLAAIGNNNKLPSNHRSTTKAVGPSNPIERVSVRGEVGSR